MFDESVDAESILINPFKFFESIQVHFNNYVKTLREGDDTNTKQAFERAIALKWGLSEPDRIIGMTEDEFRCGTGHSPRP